MPSEAELERLVVRVNGDSSGYRKTMEDVRSQTNLTDGHIQFATKRIQAFGLSLRGYGAQAAAAVLPLVGAAGLVGSAWKGIGLAAEFEKNEVAFSTMLQSASKGKDLMKEIAALAAETPMNQADLQAGAKMLLQYGTAANKVTDTLRMLGDVASGDSQTMMRIALQYGQVKTLGRVQGDELNIIRESGFDPLREMARKKAGKSEGAEFDAAFAEINKLKEQGGVTFKMLEDAFKSATAEGGQFFNGMKNQAGTLSGLFSTMQDDVDASLRAIGTSLIENLNLKGFLKEISAGAQRFKEWFESISPETKRAAAAVAAATAAFVGLTAAIVVAGIAFNVAFGGIGVVAGTIITAVGAVVGLTAGWVIGVGGLAEAWEKVKENVRAAWEWTKPIREALVSLGDAVWEGLVAAWDAVKEAVASAWESIAGGAEVNWGKVRDAVRDAVLLMEFSLRNFGQTADMLWKKYKYDAISSLEDVRFFFTDVLPAAVQWFFDNASEIQRALYNWMGEAALVAADNVAAAFMNVDWNDVWAGFRSAMLDSFMGRAAVGQQVKKEIQDIPKAVADVQKGIKPFVIPVRKIGDLEAQWKREYEEAAGRFNQDFEAFKQKKLAEFERDRQIEMARMLAGFAIQGLGIIMKGAANDAAGLNNEMRKVKDTLASFSGQSLVGSAADRRKIQDAMYAAREGGLRNPAATVRGQPVSTAGVVGGALGGGAVPILQRIADLIAKQNADRAAQGGFIMLPANIGR